MRIFAFVCGIVFLTAGMARWVPSLTEHGYLLKIFKVNLPLNTLYLITGLGGLLAGFLGKSSVLLYFQIIGILFAIGAILGFIYENTNILGIFASNIANTWMHVIVATAALILGYGSED